MIKVGLISSAHVHAKSYAEIFKRRDDVFYFVGIWDDEIERGKKFAMEFNVEFYGDIEKIAREIDVAVVVSENVKHVEHIEVLAPHVDAILSEKPLSVNVDGAVRAIEVCRKNSCALGTAFPVRYHSVSRKMKEILESGKIGEILMITSTNHGKLPPGWFTDPKLSGGGAIMDHVVHVVDLLRWFTSKEFKSVLTFIADNIHSELEVEDAALLVLELDEIPVTLDCSWSRPKAFPIWGDVTFRIVGTKGVLDADVFSQNLIFYSNTSNEIRMVPYGANADEEMLVDFARRVEKGQDLFVTGEDGLEATRVVEYAYKSAGSGMPEVIERE